MQALIITAYKDMTQLIKLIESTCNHFLLYVHIDKKSDIDIDRIIEYKFPNLYIIRKYDIVWGGFNHLAAIIHLLNKALEDKRVTYIHVISGQDVIVKPFENFDNMFSNSKKIYMTCSEVGKSNPKIQKRLERYVLSANMDSRKKSVKIFNMITFFFQYIFVGKRKGIGEFRDIYKGMIWVSMPVEATKYVIQYVNNNINFLREFKHIVIPEEFFFQTILMNSPFKQHVVADNLRYTDWSYRNGSVPAILDETDYRKIKESDSFFARKIDMNISKKLLLSFEAEKDK